MKYCNILYQKLYYTQNNTINIWNSTKMSEYVDISIKDMFRFAYQHHTFTEQIKKFGYVFFFFFLNHLCPKGRQFLLHCLWCLTAFTSTCTVPMNKAELKAMNTFIYVHREAYSSKAEQQQVALYCTMRIHSFTWNELLLPLISNPLPHDSLAPVIPCWTESGTRVHGCHLCVFQLKNRWRFLVMVWCWEKVPWVVDIIFNDIIFNAFL